MKTKAFRAALPYTLPICVGFLFLGMSYGFLMRSQGFSFVYPMLMSLFIFAGSMEFVTANLLLMPTFQPLHAFLLPGGTAAAAQAHVCRTVCRRAERRICQVAQEVLVDENIMKFVNRLSDYFFVLARFNNYVKKQDEIFWDKDC